MFRCIRKERKLILSGQVSVSDLSSLLDDSNLTDTEEDNYGIVKT